MRGVIRWVVAALALAVTLLAYENVFSDDPTLLPRAQAVAASFGGHPQMTEAQRTPFGATITFEGGPHTVVVHCRRAALFLGEWGCQAD